MLLERIQLEPGEKVLKIVRKHWFVIMAELLGTLILLIVPLVVIFAISFIPTETIQIDLDSHLSTISFIISIWTLLIAMSAFTIWTNYFLDSWIITDRRIIVVEHIRFFHRSVGIFRLERLQDIEFSVKGIIPTLLNFGSLKAQTAGALESNFKSSGLPDPRNLQALIQKATDARLTSLNNHPDTTK